MKTTMKWLALALFTTFAAIPTAVLAQEVLPQVAPMPSRFGI